MAHGDAREGKWRGNWRMEWVASTLHSTSEHGVSSITTADAHTSAASSRLKGPPPRADLNGLVRFARKTKFGFCVCAITFQTQPTPEGFPSVVARREWHIVKVSLVDMNTTSQRTSMFCWLFMDMTPMWRSWISQTMPENGVYHWPACPTYHTYHVTPRCVTHETLTV